ncbi:MULTISPECIES: prohibitin family protein [Undibacterium]|uniref:Prohibitin family protein n=1 Tax=Undibacterium umbellatum TaxID=2762300 RepID=A0ABR6Z5D2_9BURK|nr:MULTISPECIES: prohibitin family protein [Undibacterium]MBC3906994.1 prohibitin family protein [Undibacterium umbellatum]MDP1977358.1 prohibitin family protein [Undibacterium sp.]
MKNLLKIAAGVIALLFLFALSPFATIPAGHRGVLTTFGKPSDEVYSEGIHWVWPVAQKMHRVSVAIQKGEGDGDAASKDLQTVHTKIAINYHVRPDAVVSVYRDLGNEPGERIIIPSVQEAVKAVTARFTAEELISRRSQVRDEIILALKERMARHGLVVDEFSIVNFNFSKTFNEAIEAKTTADQLKMKAERDLQRIEVEAKQKIARARAEAEALSLQRQQVTPELLRLRETENQAKAIEKWDGRLPTTVGGAVPFINVNK